MSRSKSLCAALAAFLFCLPAAAGAQEVFSNPARQIEVIGKIKTGQRVVIVPTLMLKWMTYGKVSKTASPHAFQQNTRAARSTTEVVSPADPAAMVQLSQALYMDLVEKLRAAGWEVVTADALAAEQLKWSTIPVDPALGLPSDEFTYDAERRYAIAAPDGMPVLKTVAGGKFLAPGNGMLINRIAKERDAAVLIPTFIFDTAELDQSTRQGFNNVTATTSANAALLIGGSANVSSPRGFMTVAVRQPVTVAEDIGALRKLDARGDDRFTATVRFLGGLAKVSKAAYAVEADSARLQAEALRAGGGFNAEIVARMP